MSKPREIAHLLKNKFGSADNITALTSEYWLQLRRAHRHSYMAGNLPTDVFAVPYPVWIRNAGLCAANVVY